MKKIFLFAFTLICIQQMEAQNTSGNSKLDAIIKQMKNKSGVISANAAGALINESGQLIYLGKTKGYIISTNMATATNTITLLVPKINSGKYPTIVGDDNMVIVHGVNYVIREGMITIKNSDGKISGSFVGKLYSIDKKKSKFIVPAGNLSGTFTGIGQ